MKAQVLNQYDDKFTADQWVNLEDVEDPKIEKATDVIVRIGGAGVCRTDLHIIEGVWRPHMDPDGNSLLPLIMGHENAGWVEDSATRRASTSYPAGSDSANAVTCSRAPDAHPSTPARHSTAKPHDLSSAIACVGDMKTASVKADCSPV